ncbi:DUF2490 domain-containing protein [Coraliomargarita parva]|uniref:DUF2490 domain-containing protein n=1 Tax=Coraliomargarita parva TaxID=3014050 RepID=UPI0022B4ABEE|nr:DUF2490 domain-containing protein [Coraliomargarita parva]
MMNKFYRLFRTFVPAAVLLFSAALPSLKAEFDNDVRYWQTVSLNLHEDEDWRVTMSGQTRLFDDAKFLGAWLLLPTVEYKMHPNFDVGATYLLEDIRSDCGDEYGRLHIFWLHVSPHWQLTDDLKFSMRHVLGYRAVESSENYWISRHRFALSYKLENMGPLVAVGASTELFYNYETDHLFENRLVPLSLTFKLTDQMKLSLYGMAQSKRAQGCQSWQTAYVFGQSLSYKF